MARWTQKYVQDEERERKHGEGGARDKRQSAEAVGRQETGRLVGLERSHRNGGIRFEGREAGAELWRRGKEEERKRNTRGRGRKGTRENLLREWGNRTPAEAKTFARKRWSPIWGAGGRGRIVEALEERRKPSVLGGGGVGEVRSPSERTGSHTEWTWRIWGQPARRPR